MSDTASKFDRGRMDGVYDVVSPGEVCSYETAKKIGIADPKTFYQTPYLKDVKKFNASDASTATRSLCFPSRDGAVAYQHCALEYGIGFVRDEIAHDKCVTVSCPTGWVERRGECIKPLEDYVVSKRAHCDERWYDWFTVPNYHIGNKIGGNSNMPGYCYAECPAYHVPAYGNDPVDGESAGANATDKIDACANKNDYMGGKYTGTSDYCPLAWIMRLSSTPETLKTTALQQFDELKKTAGGEENLNEHAQYLHDNLDGTTQQVYRAVNTAIENVSYQNNAMQQACKSIATQERLNQAYAVCEELSKDEQKFVDRFATTSTPPEIVTKKVAALKQACNAVFCNPTDDNAMLINKEPLCFANISNVQAEEIVEQTDADKEEEEMQKPPPVDTSSSMRYITRALMIGLYLVLAVLVIVLLVILGKWLWKNSKCILLKIYTRGRVNCKELEMAEKVRDLMTTNLDNMKEALSKGVSKNKLGDVMKSFSRK